MKHFFIRNFFSGLILILVVLGTAKAQMQEPQIYRSAVNITDPAARIAALEHFEKTFPHSQYLVGVKYYLFASYLDLGKTDSALVYAGQFVDMYPPESRVNIYNDVADILATKKVGLDSADVYSYKALSLAQKNGVRNIWAIFDTRALVLYDLGKADSALLLEKQALKGNEDDPDVLNHLSMYQAATGKKTAALNTAARAILMGNTGDALSNFNKWIKEVKASSKEQKTLSEKIADKAANDYLKNNKDENFIKAKSNVAVFFANLKINLSKADKLSREALRSLKNNFSVEDKVEYTKNYAIVKSAQGKYGEALKILLSIKKLVDPWDNDYWYALGSAYEKTSHLKKAEDAYFSGLLAGNNTEIIAALKSIKGNKNLTQKEIEQQLNNKIQQMAKFKPGHYKPGKASKGRVVLAELFTGAECPPCAGADYAYDDLSEYYPRSALAILEYHVHIPGPDPLTNPNTFQRYMYYGGNFGTPTAFINGTEKLTGGGPKFIVPNRFYVYKYCIDKFMDEKPEAQLSGSVQNTNDNVKINLHLKSGSKLGNNTTLHIALAEKDLNYAGGNGVVKQLFVVRNLIGGAYGLPIKLNKESENFNESINVEKVEKSLTDYLDNPTKYPSWRRNLRFTGWREKPDKINRNNLAVVAWVQNNESKQILQAIYLNVPKETKKQ